jgi:hypothetical protein
MIILITTMYIMIAYMLKLQPILNNILTNIGMIFVSTMDLQRKLYLVYETAETPLRKM